MKYVVVQIFRMRKRLQENVKTANCFLRKFDFFQFSLFFISSNIDATNMITLRLEVGSFELELRQVDVAGDAPGLQGELLTAVNKLGAGAGGFHLVVVDMVNMVMVDMIIVVIGDMVIVNMGMVNHHDHDQGAPGLEDHWQGAQHQGGRG